MSLYEGVLIEVDGTVVILDPAPVPIDDCTVIGISVTGASIPGRIPAALLDVRVLRWKSSPPCMTD